MARPVVIRDAVWGDVELPPELTSLLDTPELQRLRGVRQLGTAHLVYPSANHTRFEHVLGTCHVAGRMLAGLPGALDPRARLGTLAAALVHDVGHVPFGHTFEDERRLFPRHDGPERTRHFLGETALGEALERLGLRGFVRSALGAAEPQDEAAPALAADVVSGTVCADLLDYLARDALFTGIRRAYDERVFRYLKVAGGRLVLGLAKRGLPRADAFSEVIHLLRLRYTLSERVYYHHAKVTSGALVSKLVERAVAAGLTLEALFPLSDEGLLALLERDYAPDDPVLAGALADLRARRLPKRAYVLTRRIGEAAQQALVARFHEDRAERERVEAELERELGLPAGAVILSCPEPRMALKEAAIGVDVGGAEAVSLADLALVEVDELLEKHRDLWRFCALIGGRHVERRAELTAACEARFGHASELR